MRMRARLDAVLDGMVFVSKHVCVCSRTYVMLRAVSRRDDDRSKDRDRYVSAGRQHK